MKLFPKPLRHLHALPPPVKLSATIAFTTHDPYNIIIGRPAAHSGVGQHVTIRPNYFPPPSLSHFACHGFQSSCELSHSQQGVGLGMRTTKLKSLANVI